MGTLCYNSCRTTPDVIQPNTFYASIMLFPGRDADVDRPHSAPEVVGNAPRLSDDSWNTPQNDLYQVSSQVREQLSTRNWKHKENLHVLDWEQDKPFPHTAPHWIHWGSDKPSPACYIIRIKCWNHLKLLSICGPQEQWWAGTRPSGQTGYCKAAKLIHILARTHFKPLMRRYFCNGIAIRL